jgi:hypothetical protein
VSSNANCKNNSGHAFSKFIKKESNKGSRQNKGGKKNQKGKQKRENKSPLAYCIRCGRLMKKEKHHIFPQWVFKILLILGLIPKDAINDDTIYLCPRCHHEIEMINQKFEAVRMQDSEQALAEIFERFLSKERISNEYIISMAERKNSSCSIGERVVITQRKKTEVEV